MSTFGVQGTTLNAQQMYALARYAGFSADDAIHAAAVGLAWSGGDTNRWDLPTGQLGLWGQPYIDPKTGLVPADRFRQYGSADSFAQSPARQASQALDAFRLGGIDALRSSGLSALNEAVGIAQVRWAASETSDLEVPQIVGSIQAGLNQTTPPQVGTMPTSTSGTAPVMSTSAWSIGLTPSQRPAVPFSVPSAATQVAQNAPTAHAVSTLGIAAIVVLAVGVGWLLWRERKA